ncbi:TonB-dependent receptor domain-containing protein [Alteromonas lipotrueiana]|uniref:TonB-dependent receptor n=1 Tax=Alteromonas lipotrueiana TaxID=2803815 RepID=UPI001C462D1D
MKKNPIMVALLSCMSFAATADETSIETIVVTSDFQKATLDQLSASATIVGEQRVQSRQAEYLADILNIAPNVNFAAGASRGRFVQIRGIGERSQFAEPINPSVSFLVDDFDFSGLGATGVLFDTQQVEVFRGPQSTLFGTGALAGAIKIVSAQPTEDQTSHVQLRAGNKNSYRIEGAAGQALSDSVRYRVSAVHNASDGFVENRFLNRSDTNNIDETAARLAVQWDIDNNTVADISYRWYDIDNGYDAFSLDNTRESFADEPGFDEQQTHAVSARVTQNFDAGQLTILATHASHNTAYGYDEDWVFPAFHPATYSSFDAYFRSIDTQTAEIRFTSSPSTRLFNNTTGWTLGAHFKGTDEALTREYTYAPEDFVSEYTPTTKAFYGETQSQLSQDLALIVGLRFENYDFDYADNQGMQQSHNTDMVGGKVALQYSAWEKLWYASVSRGFKGGGINPAQRVSSDNRFFEEEYNWNYELGVKGPFINSDITLRAALFYMQRDNTQVNDFDVEIRADGTPDFIDIIDNADLGTNQGFEAEANWQVNSRWQLQASVGYLDARFEQYTNAKGEQVDEQRQAQAPKWTANLFSDVVLTETLSWRAEIDFKDRYRFSDGHDVMSPSATLFNTQINWQQEVWSTTLWVKNLFDKTYYVRGFGGFSNDPRDNYAFNEPYYQLAEGRQFGITFNYQF